MIHRDRWGYIVIHGDTLVYIIIHRETWGYVVIHGDTCMSIHGNTKRIIHGYVEIRNFSSSSQLTK